MLAAKKDAPATNAAAKDSQVLPNREQQTFKSIVRFYDTKQYKKGIKAADQILKKYPDHGETLAMKGLILNCMKKKDEAKVLVKTGLSKNVKSHVCWHVYGLIYRAEHMYSDAIKCYQQALRLDADNPQILKDLSLLQIQQRDAEGFEETRRKLLLLKTNNKNNWLAYAIGAHLTNNYEKALQIINSYEGTQNEEERNWPNYENSEMYLYKCSIMQEAKQYEKALEQLAKSNTAIRDKVSAREMKAELLFSLGKKDESIKEYRRLLKINSEKYEYHFGLRRALDLEPEVKEGTSAADQDAALIAAQMEALRREPDSAHARAFSTVCKRVKPGRFPHLIYQSSSAQQIEGLKKLYEELATEFPKCAAVKRLPLDFLSGADFRAAVDTHMRAMIRKAIPSLFRDLRPLYSNLAKLRTIEELVLSYISNLRQAQRFSQADEEGSEIPDALLWALFYAAQHFDFLGDTTRALELVNEALTHTPTVIDAHVLKARIYKHAGDHTTAFRHMNAARLMDLADRYLNTKCVRYAFRAQLPEEADKIVALFLREDGEGLHSLYDMQVMWYELASGRCYQQQHEYGKALKKYMAVDKHFEDVHEDQFDFHTYCIRKSTLRSYVSMLRWQDNLRSHRFFNRAAKAIIDCYLEIISKEAEEEPEEEGAENLSPEERKKRKKMAKRKAARDKKKQQAAKADAKKEVRRKDRDGEIEIDDDPDGDKLAANPTPLETCAKFARTLQLYSSSDIQTHLLSAEVQLRRGKYLLVLQALKRAAKLEPTHPTLHRLLVQFFVTVDGLKESDGTEAKAPEPVKKEEDGDDDAEAPLPPATIHPMVRKCIEQERTSNDFLQGQLSNLGTYMANYQKQFGFSLPHRVACAEASLIVAQKAPEQTEATRKRAIELIMNLSGEGVTHQECVRAHNLLLNSLKDKEKAAEFKALCNKHFPFTPSFMTEEQLAQLKEQAEKKEEA